jgi:uncharacterized protein DUF1579
MKIFSTLLARVCFGICLFAGSALLGQDQAGSPSTAPSPVLPPGTTTTTGSGGGTGGTAMPNQDEMMKQMMEMGKVNENHKLLSSLDGTWNYKIKFWMNGDPSSKPEESSGTAIRKSMMGGRFTVMDVSGKMKMPGPDGKMKETEFKGQGIDGYDNAKQKFVGSWVDNMGTGIMMSEGTYDPATKTMTYTADYQMTPSMKQQIREVITLTDKDHMKFEWLENRGGQDVKTMQIDYTRAGKK